MIKLYEIEDHGTCWEVYDSYNNYITVLDPKELDGYLDNLRSDGIDFAMFTLDWYEYHLALEDA